MLLRVEMVRTGVFQQSVRSRCCEWGNGLTPAHSTEAGACRAPLRNRRTGRVLGCMVATAPSGLRAYHRMRVKFTEKTCEWFAVWRVVAPHTAPHPTIVCHSGGEGGERSLCRGLRKKTPPQGRGEVSARPEGFASAAAGTGGVGLTLLRASNQQRSIVPGGSRHAIAGAGHQ